MSIIKRDLFIMWVLCILVFLALMFTQLDSIIAGADDTGLKCIYNCAGFEDKVKLVEAIR